MRMRQKAHRYISFLFVAILASTLFTTILAPSVANAAASYESHSIEDRAKTFMLSRGVAQCIAKQGFDNQNYSNDDIRKGKWLEEEQKVGEWTADLSGEESNDDKAECKKIAEKAVQAMGWDAVDAICKMNEIAGKEVWERERGDCKSGTGDLDFDEGTGLKNNTDVWNNFFRQEYLDGKGIDESLTNGMRYIIYSENFYQECSKDHAGSWNTPRVWADGDTEDKYTYKLKWNKKGASPDKEWYVVSGGNDKDHTIKVGGYGSLVSGDDVKCKTAAERINEYAQAYADEAATNGNTGNNGSSGASNTEETCESEGGVLAWFLCAVIGNILDGIIDTLDSWINNLLFVDGDRYRDPAITAAWSVMRNIALLILVPMMMFMVIGTAIGFGPFDAYTVKKALPRMVIATLFIVLSLPITQFGVALSNEVGQGIGNLIVNAAPTDASSLSDILANHAGAATVTGFSGLVVGTAVAAATVTIGMVGSFALITAVALLIGFVILVMRQVLLVTLMVVAPLAILVWIFPGNDKLWTIWKTTFIAMLLMYPIIAVLLASGRFVAGLFG